MSRAVNFISAHRSQPSQWPTNGPAHFASSPSLRGVPDALALDGAPPSSSLHPAPASFSPIPVLIRRAGSCPLCLRSFHPAPARSPYLAARLHPSAPAHSLAPAYTILNRGLILKGTAPPATIRPSIARAGIKI